MIGAWTLQRTEVRLGVQLDMESKSPLNFHTSELGGKKNHHRAGFLMEEEWIPAPFPSPGATVRDHWTLN